MNAISPFLKDDPVFNPDDIKAMSTALEDVCTALNLRPDSDRAREAVAARIIELARGGERSPTKLRDRVLSDVNGGTGL
jgi:hypothetical protein